ncbi:hypothetical protein KC19_11G075100 [Ceratodon purpureus]|uniref:Uncharacterized protein n=1 Tax=Ceratodon purpureus TaxID=3225 RepID=A0A8T0GDZ1_CERPU|nr:hypothetical protein KC19_11G075100 [Ceratodon purpureus]
MISVSAHVCISLSRYEFRTVLEWLWRGCYQHSACVSYIERWGPGLLVRNGAKSVRVRRFAPIFRTTSSAGC